MLGPIASTYARRFALEIIGTKERVVAGDEMRVTPPMVQFDIAKALADAGLVLLGFSDDRALVLCAMTTRGKAVLEKCWADGE